MDYYDKMLQADWVFFDFFDTLMHRDVSDTQGVERWSIEMSERLRYVTDASNLYRYRMKAVQKCYLEDKETEEISYCSIMKRMYTMLHTELRNYSFEDFFSMAYACELKVEREVLSLDEDSINKARVAVEKGKNVGIISDFYLGTKELLYFLSNSGVDCSIFKKIYVSSEYGKKKRTGNLYQVVLKELEIEANRCLMFGDNLVSDKQRAEEAGFIAIQYKYQNPHHDVDIRNILSEIDKKHRTKPFANYGFGVYYYIKKIYQVAVSRKYRKIAFLAREGYLLKELFDFYQKDKELKIHTEYLYASRLSTFLPSLGDLEKENFSAVLTQYADISLKAFLKNLQFDETLSMDIANQLSLDSHTIIYDFAKSEEFARLKENKLFRDTYEEKRNAAIESLMGYMQPLLSGQEEIVLVDIGWKGTMQDNLYKAFGGRPIIGLYYGIFAQTGNEGKNNIKEGLVFSQFPERSKYYYTWEFETHLIEQLFAAPHGSTKGYMNNSGSFQPILDQSEDDKKLYSSVEKYQRYLKAVFEEIHSVMKNNVINDDDFFVIATKAQLRSELCISAEQLQFEKIALSEKTNNFGWFSKIPAKYGKLNKIINMLKSIKGIHDQDGESSLMRYLSYFSIKMNAREKYGWKKYFYRLVYHIEKGRIR